MDIAVEQADNPEEFRLAITDLVRSQIGGQVVHLEPIAAGLGTRVFLRVQLADCPMQSAIARIEMPEDPAGRPKGIPAEPTLEPLRNFLERAGLPVPRSYALEGRIQLLEDAGDVSLEDAAGRISGDDRRALYAEAAALVPRLQRLSASPDEVPAFGRRLEPALFAYKADLVAEWVLPLALGREPRKSESDSVRDAFAWIAQECQRGPARLSHRDFKAANMLLREPGAGEDNTARLTLIDLQGAFMAPPEYDLVSLLRDSHVALPEGEVETLLASVRRQLPDAPDPESYRRRFEILTLTRVGKDLARYLYAAQTRGDRRYLALVPRAVSILRHASRIALSWHPTLERLAELIDRIPTETPEAFGLAEPRHSAEADHSCGR